MRRDDYWAALLVASGFLAATLTGFLRQAAIAQQFGIERVADIYLVAFALPEFIFIILPIVLSPALIPIFSETRQKAGEIAAWRLGFQTAGGLLLSLGVFTLLAFFLAPTYLGWLSPGFTPAESALAIQAARLMLPSLILMGLATVGSIILQIYRRFTRPALITAVYNLVFIAILLLLPFAQPLERAAWGVSLGAAAALLFQLPLLWEQYRQIQKNHSAEIASEKSAVPGVGRVARLAGPLAIGYAVHHLILFIDRAMATTLGTGSVSTLSYADHLALVVGQISGLAVSTVIFPSLSEQINQQDLPRARANLGDAVNLVARIALPASVGLIILREPIVQTLFERGAFDRAATIEVSTSLIWYTIAVFSDSLSQPFWRVIYAQRRAWTVFMVNAIQTLIRLIGNIVFIHYFGYTGLAISAALGLSLQTLILGWLVWQRLGWPAHWQRSVWQTILATCGAALCSGGLAASLSAAQPLITIVACGLMGSFVYLLLLRLLTLKENAA